jgi:hypothetical protein
MKKPSQTDWERIDKLTDEEIDTSDIPLLDDSFFAKARLRMPRPQVPVTMHVDAECPELDISVSAEASDVERSAILQRLSVKALKCTTVNIDSQKACCRS